MSHLTDFQTRCEARLREVLGRYGLHLVNRVVEPGLETYIRGQISDARVDVWIYEDDAQLTGNELDYRYEHQDFKSSDELIEQLIKDVEDLLQRKKSGIGQMESS